MAIFNFDRFDKYEIPTFELLNPDGTSLYNLGTIYDRQLKLRYNALSELSFTAPAKVNGVVSDYYSTLDYRRIVNVQNIGMFMITGLEINSDGIIEETKVTCQSIEVELNFKHLSVFSGTYKFYDFIDPNPTLMGIMLTYIPGWTIGHIDANLAQLYRTFNVTDKTIYSFLTGEVSQTYQAIFVFNIITKTISAYATDTATTPTDIYLDYNTLIENVKIKEITEELVTSLGVFGADPLSINRVNPLGSNNIFNFTYYKKLEWMSQSLIDSLTIWENKVTANQVTYANLLTDLIDYNTTLITQQGELATLQGELAALLEIQKVRIQQKLSITAINALIKAKRAEITAKEAEIAITQGYVDTTNASLTAINTDLSFVNNFTNAQILELNNFIIGSTYTNTNFIQTDIMTSVEVQQMAQELYDQAILILAKVSEPRYSFEVDSANFVFLKEFQTFINQLALGSTVTIAIRDGVYTYPAILGIDYNYDEPTSFKLILSSRLRLDDAAFQFSDLFNQTVNSGLSTTFNSEIWSNFQKNYKDDVSVFLTSALDASKNAVINATNQEFIIDSVGLRGRYLDPATGLYDPKQLWMINNMLVFTNDDWDSCSLALGEITTPFGTTAYGLAAQVIVGTLLAGNQLFITNENNTFNVDGSGATLIDASFTLTRSDGNSRILIDPDIGIAISKRDNTTGSYVDQFYADSQGNIIFTGNLSGASGTFTGSIEATSGKIGAWSIDNFGLYDVYGNYIYGNGKVRLGMLTIDGSEAWFNGNIYANNINGLIEGWQIGSLNADVINAGTLSAVDIYGCDIYWPGVRMWSPGIGYSYIQADNSISMFANDAAGNVGGIVNVSPTGAYMGEVAVVLGSFFGGTNITFNGTITTTDVNSNTGVGISGTFVL